MFLMYRAAAATYAQLLNSQSDNNVKLIVLERLDALKKQHAKVLQASEAASHVC